MNVSELQLRDVVKLFDGDYSYATVYRITDTQVFMIRPYIHTSEFITTSGVITYIGHEDIIYQLNSSREFELVSRSK